VNLKQFTTKSDLLSKTELEKVKLLAFYHQSKQPDLEFTMDMICSWFSNLSIGQPNKYRLKINISKSKFFINGSKEDTYRLHAKVIASLRKEYPELLEIDEEVYSIGEILPLGLYDKTRGYIESLAKQINASYESNIFDGAAVLMRRLLEICLIHSYQNHSIEHEIMDSRGNYKSLSDIINNAISNHKLGLSKTPRSCLDDFRTIGNFSAHKIYYNAKRGDLKKCILDYRATIEELLYKAGIKK
jgi:hypothetical protein